MTDKRTIIVGDVHGMLTELAALLKAVDFNADNDRLVAVGDLIHKGPDSAGVVKMMRALGAELVKGNHEEQQERFRKALRKVKGDASKLKMKNVEDKAELEELLNDEDVEFLENAKLFVCVPGGVVVHGGILPTMESLPTDEELAEFSKGDLKKLERVLRVRFVRGKAEAKVTVEFDLDFDPEVEVDQGLTTADLTKLFEAMGIVVKSKKVRPKGDFLALGQNRPGDPFWADGYDGRFGHVFFGHQPFLDEEAPKLFPHATGLDLGAVFGGRLAAVVLEEGRAPRAVTVEATAKYADPLEEDE